MNTSESREGFANISVAGKIVTVPAAQIDGQTVVVTGRWIKVAAIHDEHWVTEGIEDPAPVVALLRQKKLGADIFTFSGKLTETQPRFNYLVEWDNWAVIPITTFSEWWEKRLPQETRKNVRRSQKREVVVRTVAFDDALVAGIKSIYDETPLRQRRKFWHYGKDLETVKRENSTYLEQAELLGAFYQDELIGYLKIVYVGKIGSIMQITSKTKYYDKRPVNALLAKAVEILEQKKIAWFIYGKSTYGNKSDSPLEEFKRRNGFEKMRYPVYFIPLTFKGRVALALKLHRGALGLLPPGIIKFLVKVRAWILQRSVRPAAGAVPHGQPVATSAD